MTRAAPIVLRFLVGGTFLYSGLSKVGAPLQALAAVYSYQIVVPDWAAEVIAAALPWMEILLGLALVAGVWLPVALGWTALMLCGFTALTAQAWWRELPIDCGCADYTLIHPALAALTTPGGATLRNIALLGAVAAIAVLARKSSAGR